MVPQLSLGLKPVRVGIAGAARVLPKLMGVMRDLFVGGKFHNIDRLLDDDRRRFRVEVQVPLGLNSIADSVLRIIALHRVK